MTRGRDVTALLRILPGVVKDSGNEQLGTQNVGQINGVRGDYNSLSIDGTTGNTRGGANLDTPANEDSVGEVKVLLNNYQAEYGQSAGAIVEMVTKSGTRNFHGSVYYYNRNEAFNANDYFTKNAGLPRSVYRFNTIGYNIGGPIFIPKLFNTNKEKLFFFFSQEIWPSSSPGKLLHFTMPTALERTGDFSASVDKNGNPVLIADPVLIAQGKTCKKSGDAGCFTGNRIPASRIDADTQKLMSILPLPQPGVSGQFGGGLYNYITQPTIKKPVNQQVIRVDYNINSKFTYLLPRHEHQ